MRTCDQDSDLARPAELAMGGQGRFQSWFLTPSRAIAVVALRGQCFKARFGIAKASSPCSCFILDLE